MNKLPALAFVIIAVAIAGCGGGGGGGTSTPKVTGPVTVPTGTATATPTPGPNATATPTATPSPAATATPLPQIPLALNVNNLPGQYYGEIVAQLSNVSPREMVMLPNGDLLFGTGGGTATSGNSGAVYILPNPEGTPPAATVFATLTDTAAPCAGWVGSPNVNGVTFAAGNGGGTIFVGMECSVWKIPYVTGDHTASSAPTLFAKVRTGATAGQANDADIHHTTSVLAVGNTLYVGVGSSCNACTETDDTRGAVLTYNVTSGARGANAATRLRNALALAVNPATSAVWAGGAGQDCVVDDMGCFNAMDNNYQINGHPYEWIDPITKHGPTADYKWPWCEENGTVVNTPDGPTNPLTAPGGTSCTPVTNMIVAPVRAPAYETIIGATFYEPPNGATYAFPGSFKNGLFMSLHGSWHENSSGIDVAPPQVVFVPITGTDTPVNPMDWTNGGNPYSTWALGKSGNPAAFMNGFQSQGIRIGRPVGLAVGLQGSLFIADDQADAVYRIRPGTAPASIHRIAPASVATKAPVPVTAPTKAAASGATTLLLPPGSTSRR